MKKLNYCALSAGLLFYSAFTLPAQGETTLNIEEVTIEAPLWTMPATTLIENPQSKISSLPYSDSADFLNNVAGISAGRFGGHGLDPVMRGQTQNQLNIKNNDGYTFGACPNRMDPPTAYISIQPHDEIEIIRGYQSVLNGFGGSGGSIIIKENAPDFSNTTLKLSDLFVYGQLQGGYDSNSVMWNNDATITAGTNEGYATANAGYKSSENYKDGDGHVVRSAFDETKGSIKLGFTPEDNHFYISMDYHDIEDALFPGAGMDSPYSKSYSYKAGWEKEFENALISRIKLNGYASLVDHSMDNFSLRPQTAIVPLRVTSQSDTYGAKLETDLALDENFTQAVIEWRRNNRDSERFNQTNGLLQSLLWPDITLDEVALGIERTYDIKDNTRFIVGGRYDYVHVDYGSADKITPAAGGITPNAIYNQFYGYHAQNEDEHNFGGLLRFEHDYSESTLFYTGISRSVRTADATERGLANYMGPAGAMSWVGNPRIKPEKHHQFDIGFEVQKPAFSYSGSAYANFVQDYILRDSARGQPTVLVNYPNADIYRNIDAILAGMELSGSWQFTDDWRFNADIAYTYGQDIESGRALPQIPPLQGKIGITWAGLDYLELDTTIRWAAQQSRVDLDATTGTGRDVAKTNGYAIFDVAATLTHFEPVSLTFGVSNLFDKRYASHLNRSNISDPTEIQVNEPGRSIYLQMKIPF